MWPDAAERIAVCFFAALVMTLWSGVVAAQTSNDVLDTAHGAEIKASSPTVRGFGPEGVIGGATKGESNAGATIFKNGGVNFVEIHMPTAVVVEGVELYCRADSTEPNAPRSVAKFSFAADADNDGTFEAVLVDGAVPANNGLVNRYPFPAITASAFKAEFEAGATTAKERAGPRIVELDAIGAPRSLAVLWESLGGIGVIMLLVAGIFLRRQSNRRNTSSATS